MPWGVNTEYSEEEAQEVKLDDNPDAVDRGEAGEETTEDFDIDDALSNLK